MVVQSSSFVAQPLIPVTSWQSISRRRGADVSTGGTAFAIAVASNDNKRRWLGLGVRALDRNSSDGSKSNNNHHNKGSSPSSSSAVPNSNYVVPLDNSSSSSCITRPLAEILRDLNKRIPDNIIKPDHFHSTFIPWYHANRMLSFYAPGWCGEIRDVIFSETGSVTVVYRVTIRGSDGEAHRESTGTVSSSNNHSVDPVAAAEEIAFCRACARFGLGLYLYHGE